MLCLGCEICRSSDFRLFPPAGILCAFLILRASSTEVPLDFRQPMHVWGTLASWFEKLVSIILSSTLFLSISIRSQTQLSYFFLSFGHVTGVKRRPGPAIRTALVPGKQRRHRGALERRRRGSTGRWYCSRARERRRRRGALEWRRRGRTER